MPSAHRAAERTRAGAEPQKKKIDFRKAMPEIWRLVRPRKWLLLLGLVLVAINRVAGLTLPFVVRPFVNLVLRKHESDKLMPLVIAVLIATIIQSITSFSNTQLLSKAAQRMIADLRQEVQRHVGRLSVSFYDANRTGLLVSRIMSDVEGVRNLIGTGLVEFVGGLLTAVMAFIFLLHRSAEMTLIVFSVVGVFVFVLQYAFKTIRPIFRERGKDYRRSDGAADRIAGRRARGEGLPRRRARSGAYSRWACCACWTT